MGAEVEEFEDAPTGQQEVEELKKKKKKITGIQLQKKEITWIAGISAWIGTFSYSFKLQQ